MRKEFPCRNLEFKQDESLKEIAMRKEYHFDNKQARPNRFAESAKGQLRMKQEKKNASRMKRMNEMTFEESLAQLERAVEQLESGELPLEQALEIFETGVSMSRLCAQKLDEAEQKVELLLNVKDGQPETAAFDMATLQDAE